ncbi:MAG TPA: riboflavin biosynthesis protein RibF [Terriglobales bacterium]|jgi:riboflavin kinase/FMN adenylyltransferase
MRIVRQLGEGKPEPAVVAVGNFDGVHRAHQAILGAVRAEARQRGAMAVAVTFDPHPSRVLRPQQAPPLITPGNEKIRRLAATGMDEVVLLPFSRDLSLLTPLEFVEQILVRGLHAVAVHEGHNFRFGQRHAGTTADLQRFGAEFGFDVRVHPPMLLRGQAISSSAVRDAIAAGNLRRARHLLGRVFSLVGAIAPGRGIGRQRTVPTLNLQHYEELLPAAGVYLTRVGVAGATYNALTNVGVRPTFGEHGPLTVESHLLAPPPEGLSAGLGDTMEIAFLARCRDERRFDTPDALRAQILRDIAWAQRYFALADHKRIMVG